MLGTGYFLKIAKINYQQEKPICPNCKIQFLQKCTKNCPSAKILCHKVDQLSGSRKIYGYVTGQNLIPMKIFYPRLILNFLCLLALIHG